ncbi:MAG: putative lipid II flippase FtsW, partial [Alicyclobacillus sp.]|nr:putative lipid II flippase FtsW [Alicyclobacillus sp.]
MPEHRHQPDYVLYFTVLILTAIGIVTVFSASTVFALQHGQKPDYYAVRQLAYAVVGVVAMTLMMRVPPTKWYRMAPFFMLCNLPLLVLVMVAGKSIAGGKRWLGTSSFHIQPSEFAVLATVMYLAYFFSKKVTLLHDWKRGLRPAIIVVCFNFGLIIAEPDMGTSLSLLGTALVVLIASGAPLKRLFMLGLFAIPALAALAFLAPYRMARIMAFLHPFQNDNTTAYQLLQGLTAISAGGWFGRGFDMSLAKTGYLPVPHIDFIFPVFVEEWGLMGAITLMVIYAVLIWRGFLIARHAPSRFSALLAVGVVASIAVSALINLGAVTGLLPVTGIPLPFISYGGSDLVVNLASMGILLSVSCHTLAEEPEADTLADVVPVEEARERKPVDPDRAALAAAARTAQITRRTAQVHPLMPKARMRKQKATGPNWRARQEAASMRASSGRSARATGTTKGRRNNTKTAASRQTAS